MELKPARVIAIASGKGGVGKSFLTLHLGAALSRMGNRVAILDGDFGLANIELLAGQTPKRSIVDVLEGTCSIRDVLVEGADGLFVIPGCRSNPAVAELTVQQFSGLIHGVDALAGDIDYLLIDTSGGLSPTDLRLIQAASEVLVVVTPDPLVQADGVDYIRALRRSCAIQHFGILTNMTRRQREGHGLMEALQDRLGFDQDLVLRHCGQIPFDQDLARYSGSSSSGQILPSNRDESRTSRAIQMLAETLNRRCLGQPISGGMAFFLEQTVSAGGM